MFGEMSQSGGRCGSGAGKRVSSGAQGGGGLEDTATNRATRAPFYEHLVGGRGNVWGWTSYGGGRCGLGAGKPVSSSMGADWSTPLQTKPPRLGFYECLVGSRGNALGWTS
jgi:hypothetical protein